MASCYLLLVAERLSPREKQGEQYLDKLGGNVPSSFAKKLAPLPTVSQ